MIRIFSRKKLAVAATAMTLLFATGCAKKPYVEVGGTKLDESYLKKKDPDTYKELRAQYESRMVQALRGMAVQVMIQKAAKEKGITEREYMAKIRSKVGPVSMAEVQAKYEELKKSGRIGKASLADLAPRIKQFLQSQRSRGAMDVEIARLSQKYGLRIVKDVKLVKVDTKGEPSTSSLTAPVTVVEYTDFRCGYCRRVRSTAHRIQKKYGDKVRWVVKDSPFQPGAMQAHIAANCVHKQDSAKYWTFFEKVMSSGQSDFNPQGFQKMAVASGANLNAYQACLKDPKIVAEIRGDLGEGRRFGVRGTPHFFINGRALSGAQPYREFATLIDEELKKAGK